MQGNIQEFNVGVYPVEDKPQDFNMQDQTEGMHRSRLADEDAREAELPFLSRTLSPQGYHHTPPLKEERQGRLVVSLHCPLGMHMVLPFHRLRTWHRRVLEDVVVAVGVPQEEDWE